MNHSDFAKELARQIAVEQQRYCDLAKRAASRDQIWTWDMGRCVQRLADLGKIAQEFEDRAAIALAEGV